MQNSINEGLVYKFYVDSEVERFNYLITASEENTSAFVTVLNKENEELYSFKSNLFLTEQDDLELILESQKNIDTTTLLDNNILKIDFNLHGIETHAECFLRDFNVLEDGRLTINISAPFRMVRFQRRTHPRVVLPLKLATYLSFNKSEHLSKLRVINISEGGLAIMVSAPLNEIKEGVVFHNSILELPFKLNNLFTVSVKISYTKLINLDMLPKELQDLSKNENWYHVGVKFINVSSTLEESLKMLIYQASKPS